MENSSTDDKDEIYKMSTVECLLVLVVISLWLIAVINLARKLEKLCNPPSIFPNYSLYAKVSVSPSSAPNSSEPIEQRTFIRAISEPTIDASPRTVIIRSPSETCLHIKSTNSLRGSTLSHLSPSDFIDDHFYHHYTNSNHRIVHETNENRLTNKQRNSLLDPNRIPMIVRKSLIDLHRRTLFNTNITPIKCIITPDNNYQHMNINNSKQPLIQRQQLVDLYHTEENDDENHVFYISIYTRNQATDIDQFRKPSERYAVQIQRFREKMNLDYMPPLPWFYLEIV
ncbi:unnamed protein product [Didymodactylos carnosus]|uniref:Uncharacterized protein n=1 Tax=Didymodactylos carnosus TaxID=1234261 RepID=A0A814KVH3_9BILA|nr:unnamed protein product [Didymodactylos carnosus]CAF3825415.1 unnamed protein product [Didymodactylos carnosus]